MNKRKSGGTAAPVFLSVLFCFLLLGCHVESEPERIWNLRSKITRLAIDLVGLPYRLGGNEITGFDCSGLVYYVYSSFGVIVPRTAKKQGKLKQTVPFMRAKSGDILVFKLRKGWHSGIYIGEKRFVHAPNQRNPVKKETLNSYWKSKLRKVIRLIPD